MNNRERIKLDSYNRVADFNLKYATDFAAIPEYADEKTDFDDALEVINQSGVVQANGNNGIGELADIAKADMAKTVVKYTSRGSIKANRLGNASLALALDEPQTFISVAPKTLAMERAFNLRNLLNDNLTTLTNITVENIEEIDVKISAYVAIKDKPVEDIQAKKATGTNRLPEQFKKADKAVDNMYSLVFSYFSDSNPVMVDELRLAMQNIETGIHHTSVDLLVESLDTNTPIGGANVVDNQNNKSYTTDEEGNVHIANHRSGHYTFTISASGKQTVVFAVDIKRGSANAFVVKLGGV